MMGLVELYSGRIHATGFPQAVDRAGAVPPPRWNRVRSALSRPFAAAARIPTGTTSGPASVKR